MQLNALARVFTGVLFGAILGCTPAVACDDSLGGWVKPFVEDSNTVVIFVHGLQGHPRETWKSKDAKLSWPCMLRGDAAFEYANFYLYGYDAEIWTKQPTIEDLASSAKLKLVPIMEQHEQVIFVVHSMGGLVAAQMLELVFRENANRDLARAVKLVMFFGTPGSGSAFAKLATYVTDSSQVRSLAGGRDIDAIVERWQRSERLQNLSRCFAETDVDSDWWAVRKALSWFSEDGGLVVSPKSAFATCRGAGQPVYSTNHTSLVKPVLSQRGAYPLLAQYSGSCAKPIRTKDKTKSLAGKPASERIREWRTSFAQGHNVNKSNRSSLENHIDSYIAKKLDGVSPLSEYVLPESPDSTHPSSERGAVNYRVFQQHLLDQSIFATNLPQRAIALGKDVNSIVFDSIIRRRLDQLAENGNLLEDDLVVLVDDPHSSNEGQLLLLLSGDAQRNDVLKGFLRIPVRHECEIQSK